MTHLGYHTHAIFCKSTTLPVIFSSIYILDKMFKGVHKKKKNRCFVKDCMLGNQLKQNIMFSIEFSSSYIISQNLNYKFHSVAVIESKYVFIYQHILFYYYISSDENTFYETTTSGGFLLIILILNTYLTYQSVLK